MMGNTRFICSACEQRSEGMVNTSQLPIKWKQSWAALVKSPVQRKGGNSPFLLGVGQNTYRLSCLVQHTEAQKGIEQTGLC